MEYGQRVRRAFLIRKIMGSNPIIPIFLKAAMVKLVYTLGLGSNS